MTNSSIHNLLTKGVARIIDGDHLRDVLASGQKIDTVRKDCDRDNYMTAQDTLKYGLIDKILGYFFIKKMKYLLFSLVLLIFPLTSFASGMTKQEACSYPDGIHEEAVYVLWPGKIPYIQEFLKKDGFLYYFIHTFPDGDSLRAYKDFGNDANGIVKNTGSFFVSFDCARSKVKFYNYLNLKIGTAYGKLNWIRGKYLSYSLVGSRNPCTTGPDSLLDMTTLNTIKIDRIPGIPRSTKASCVGRSLYKPIEDGVVQFDIEEHIWATEESYYSRYQYFLYTKRLKKIR